MNKDQITQTPEGWVYNGQTFASKEAAELFVKSRTEAGVVRDDAPAIDWAKVASYVVACAIFVWGYKACSSGVDLKLSPLNQCQELIKASSRDPSTTKVPYTEDANKGKGSEAYFAWSPSTTPVSARNGLGLSVNVGASCIVDRASGKITSASLDGATIR